MLLKLMFLIVLFYCNYSIFSDFIEQENLTSEKTMEVANVNNEKHIRSPDYNYIFDKKTGFFARWGQDYDDDPQMAPAPELLDLEITTKCSGYDGTPCPFCYKGNNPNGKNMSFETFKNILDKINTSILTQIAFGTDASLTSNPDIWNMFDYCLNNRINKVIPNVTVSNINENTADMLSKYCGAVAVSRYDKKDICYSSVKMLIDRGIQTNIHIMVSEETYNQVMETIDDLVSDPRLSGLNAIVFLSLKKKGRGKSYTQLSTDKFSEIVNKSFENKINFGFDSCSYHKFEQSIRNLDSKTYDQLITFSEPCESSLFSSYVNVDGRFFPCSFVEGEDCFKDDGIDIVSCNNFVNDVWNSEHVKDFRSRLKEWNRKCPVFDI